MHLLFGMGGGGVYVSSQGEAPCQNAYSLWKMVVVQVEAAVKASEEEDDDEGEAQ